MMKNLCTPRTSMILGLLLLGSLSFSCKKDKPVPKITLTDADGNVYQTVKIGTQIWMASELKTTLYNDGTPIPYVADQASWTSLATPGYTWYSFDLANKSTYGGLYNWHTVNSGKLAPAGWHVPTEAEWQTLLTYLGTSNVAGDKLKEAGNAHWGTPSSSATNSSGFTALPGGSITDLGNAINLTSTAFYWSSTEVDASTARAIGLSKGSAQVTTNSVNKSFGVSVRLVKD